jgi:hypothetical protein
MNYHIDKISSFIFLNNIIAPFLTSGHYIFFEPQGMMYYPSLISSTNFWITGAVYLSFGAALLWFLFSLWTTLTFFVFFTLIYSDMVLPIITKELRYGQNEYKSLEKLRNDPQNLVNVYRSVELIHLESLQVVSPTLIPSQALFTQLILMCFYMLIRGRDGLDTSTITVLLLWSLSSLAFWTGVL